MYIVCVCVMCEMVHENITNKNHNDNRCCSEYVYKYRLHRRLFPPSIIIEFLLILLLLLLFERNPYLSRRAEPFVMQRTQRPNDSPR